VQAVPWGTADVVKNLRLRRIRTIKAGQSIVVSIDHDSSLSHDGEDYLIMDGVMEIFHVRVADAGTLTVDARPALGGIVPSIGVKCVYVADNCHSVGVNSPAGTAVRRVEANSLFEIEVSIKSQMAPQQYEVRTWLE
jgi:hypothetical protein